MEKSMGMHPTKDVPRPYTDIHLQINEIDRDNVLGGVEERFSSHASETEGVSGRKSIDTCYENTSVATVESPRSARGGPAPPSDTDRPQFPHREL
jgi:hypothetical protein